VDFERILDICRFGFACMEVSIRAMQAQLPLAEKYRFFRRKRRPTMNRSSGFTPEIIHASKLRAYINHKVGVKLADAGLTF